MSQSRQVDYIVEWHDGDNWEPWVSGTSQEACEAARAELAQAAPELQTRIVKTTRTWEVLA